MGRKNSNAAAKKAHLDAQTELLMAKSSFWREMARLISGMNGVLKELDWLPSNNESKIDGAEGSARVDTILDTVGRLLNRYGLDGE